MSSVQIDVSHAAWISKILPRSSAVARKHASQRVVVYVIIYCDDAHGEHIDK